MPRLFCCLVAPLFTVAHSPTQDRCVDALKSLAKEEVTSTVLAETQAGKKVRSLTKHKDTAIAAAANDVVTQWKKLIRRESTTSVQSRQISIQEDVHSPTEAHVTGESKPDQGTPPTTGVVEGTITTGRGNGGLEMEGSPPAETRLPEAVESQPEPVYTASNAAASSAEIPQTSDPVRNKIRANLAAALQLALQEGAQGGDPVALGVQIENALHVSSVGVNAKYKNKFRQLHFNLKDAKNPDLRRKVVEGEIAADVLIILEPEDLASDAKRKDNARIREKKLFDAAPSSVKQATTDQFQCGKCRQRKCTYYQMQTRSADEPMTTVRSCGSINIKNISLISLCPTNWPPTH